MRRRRRSSTLDGKRFFRTGDLGRVDEDGYFFMVDRLKRMINASGYKVWPAEVESMMYAHPGDPGGLRHRQPRRAPRRNGQGRSSCSSPTRQARRGRAHRLGAREHGRVQGAAVIEFVDRLPKSATGKVQWRQLQEMELAKGG